MAKQLEKQLEFEFMKDVRREERKIELEKQLEFEFMKDVRREERKIEIQRFRDRWIEPLALKITLPLGIMGGIGLTYLSKHPEYIEATQSYIKSLF